MSLEASVKVVGGALCQAILPLPGRTIVLNGRTQWIQFDD